MIKEIPEMKKSILNIPMKKSNEDMQSSDIEVVIGAVSEAYVHPELFGINTLFCTEQNSIREKEIYKVSMEHLAPKMMRYPGGTCADNYLWKKNDIYNPDWFPRRGDPVNDMDTDNFLKFAGEYGAEPIMVINYRTYIMMNDIEALYKDAEDWVKYVNQEKKAGVKYWELGNELYFKENTEIRCQVTPEQYGEHYLELRKRLKAIDPGIQLGITLHKDWINDQNHVVDRWNERVMASVKCDVDYVILHFYATPTEEGFEKKGADIRNKVKRIKAGISSLGGRSDIPLIITEWNFGSKSPVIKGQTIGHLVGLAQGFIEIIDSGISKATIWPLYNSDKRLMNENDHSVTPAGEMFHWLNSELGGCKIIETDMKSDAAAAEVKAFLSRDGNELRIVAINRSINNQQKAAISLEGYSVIGEGTAAITMSANTLNGNNAMLTDVEIVSCKQQLNFSEQTSLILPPLSVSIIKIPVNIK